MKINIVILLNLLFVISSCSQKEVELPPVASGLYTFPKLELNNNAQIKHTLLEGTSPHFEYLKIELNKIASGNQNAITLNSELEHCIIVKNGIMDITVNGNSKKLHAEGVVLLMPNEKHQITNTGSTSLAYYVMSYKSKKKVNLTRAINSGGSATFNKKELTFRRSSRGGGVAYFDRPTAMCERFEMHITQLNKKGPSHQPHAHEETEIILNIYGNTSMQIDGKQYTGKPGDFYFMDSQLIHGVSNTSDKTCAYFAFKWK